MKRQKQVKFTVRIPKDWHNALHDEAAKNDMTISDFHRESLLSSLPLRVRRSLPGMTLPGRPKENFEIDHGND